jgi:protocatechuate 3,4-dioxygenase beta subunit
MFREAGGWQRAAAVLPSTLSSRRRPMARTRGRVIGLVVVALAVAVGLWLERGRPDRPAGEGAEPGKDPARPSLFAVDPEVDRSLPAGGLEGTVIDAGGRGLAGATVVLSRTRARDSAWTGDAGRALAVVTTDGSGAFRIDELSPGSYAVTAMAEGHAPASQGPIPLAPGERRRLELRLASGGILLSGRVLDVGGGPIPGARVRAVEFSPAVGGTVVPRVFQATADEAGRYRIYLARAQYGLTAEADGYAPAHDWFMLVKELARDLRLSPAARIAGRVIEGGTGKPVPDAELWLQPHRAGGVRPRDVKSDAAGEFAFNDLEPGTYRVGARKDRLVGLSRSVSVSMAQAASKVDVEVTPGFVVAGRVLSGQGKPVAGARVQLFKDRPPFERPMFVKSGSDGGFRLEGVLPAQFRLEVSADGHARARQELAVAADVLDLAIALGPGAVVQGRVSGGDGKPLEGVAVELQVRTRDQAMMGGVTERTTSGADGSFALGGLPAGELRLSAQHPQHGIGAITGETLAAGEQKTLALRLAPGGSIAGTVKLDDGQPAAGARVEAMAMGGGGRWNDVTGADGAYKLTGVSAGKITVVAAPGARGVTWSSQDRPDQKTVALGEGQHQTGVDLVVAGSRSISGVVLGPDGKPVSGAEVSAGLERQGRAFRGGMNGRAFSGPDGAFTLERLGAGPHTVWAVQAGFADAEARQVEGGATGVKLQLAPEATISGVVTTSEGHPVRNYTITLAAGPAAGETAEQRRQRQLTWDNPVDTVHDASGRFYFPRVSAGAHELEVRTIEGSAGRLAVTVAAGEQKAGVRLVVERGARLVGKVVDRETEAPLGNVEVRAFGTSMTGNRPVVRTDGSGSFAIEGLNAGETVSLMVTGDQGTHLGERRRIEVPSGELIDAGTIRLARGNVEARIKEGTWNGFTGINPSEDGGAVLQVRPGTPAALAGIKDGDAILAIDGKDVRGAGFGVIEYALRGRPGSSITMTVQAPGAPPRTVSFTRYDAQAPLPAAPRPATASR